MPSRPDNKCIDAAAIYYGSSLTFSSAERSVVAANYNFLLCDMNTVASVSTAIEDMVAENSNLDIYLYRAGIQADPDEDLFDDNAISTISRTSTRRNEAAYPTILNGVFDDEWTAEIARDEGVPITFGSGNSWQIGIVDNMSAGDTFANKYFTAIKADILEKTSVSGFVAGIYMDNMDLGAESVSSVYIPGQHSAQAYADAMMDYIESMRTKFSAISANFITLKSNSHLTEDEAYWFQLRDSTNPPNMIAEETFAATRFGLGDVQFYSHSRWLQSCNTLRQITNSDLLIFSHCDASPGTTGESNWGETGIPEEDIRHYALASYCMIKLQEREAKFIWGPNEAYVDTPKIVAEEYAYFEVLGGIIDNGSMTPYQTSPDVYMREFESGWVFVNPNQWASGGANDTTVNFPSSGRILTHAAAASTVVTTLPTVSSAPLTANRGLFVLKVTVANVQSNFDGISG